MLQVIIYHPSNHYRKWIANIAQITLVDKVIILSQDNCRGDAVDKTEWVQGTIGDGRTLNNLIDKAASPYLFLLDGSREIDIDERALRRFTEIADITGAGMIYADYSLYHEGHIENRPLNDYQLGSIRDDFDFGALMLIPLSVARESLERFGPIPEMRVAALYDLRLKISSCHDLFHIPESLYTVTERSGPSLSGERLFDYVDPAQRDVQIEMEAVASTHLERIGAYLEPTFKKPAVDNDAYPVEASVIIPIRNRVATIGDAIASALSQKTDFTFNILVVDNHSTDDTGKVISRYAGKHQNVRHIVPRRIDLGIGGCWNEAVYSEDCGRFAIQLDSDDLYGDQTSLQKLVDMLRTAEYGMVIGSYTLVDQEMKIIPPGLIDHREWTDHNGRNNALRINGLGAPRAFVTGLLREVGFLNVSYGEDYAAALAISRSYQIGRIYDSLYWCRRWSGNTDAALSPEHKNRNDAFKDRIRSLEIRVRQNDRSKLEAGAL